MVVEIEHREVLNVLLLLFISVYHIKDTVNHKTDESYLTHENDELESVDLCKI